MSLPLWKKKQDMHTRTRTPRTHNSQAGVTSGTSKCAVLARQIVRGAGSEPLWLGQVPKLDCAVPTYAI